MTKAQLFLPGLACAALVTLSACSGTATPGAGGGASSGGSQASTAPSAVASSNAGGSASSAPSQAPSAAPVASAPTSQAAPAGEPKNASELMAKVTAGMKAVKTYQMEGTNSSSFMGKSMDMKTTGKFDQSDPGNVKAWMATTGAGSKNVTITQGTTLYMSEDGGKTFKKSSVGGSASPGAGAGQVNPNDFNEFAAKLYRDAKNFKKGATETVNGIQCTHYSFEPSLGMDAGGASAGSMQMKSKNDICVDAEWRMVKITTTADVSSGSSGGSSKSANTMIYKDFGKPVDIKIPDASQIKG